MRSWPVLAQHQHTVAVLACQSQHQTCCAAGVRACAAQVAVHILRGDLPMHVLEDLMTEPWTTLPGLDQDTFILTFFGPALQLIGLHWKNGASLADLQVMPAECPAGTSWRALTTACHRCCLEVDIQDRLVTIFCQRCICICQGCCQQAWWARSVPGHSSTDQVWLRP